jgi:outer membrane protein TolC
MTENLKSAKQRVADFKNLEKNGIIARNDLLKAQLQESKVQLALDEANKNVKVINYYLTTLLQLPDNYNIGIDMNQFGNDLKLELIDNESLAFKNRKDLAAMFFIEKANQNSIKIAKGSYFPAVTFVAGYTALNLQNVIKVTNALNFGLGFSYNLASIFKNGTEVKIAESKAKEVQESKTILTEKIKVQVQQANENFKLANKQNVVFEQAIQVATENYRIVKDKYDNGLATTNELLEADVEQLNAKINFAYSKANVMLKYYEMQESSGLLITSLTLSKK